MDDLNRFRQVFNTLPDLRPPARTSRCHSCAFFHNFGMLEQERNEALARVDTLTKQVKMLDDVIVELFAAIDDTPWPEVLKEWVPKAASVRRLIRASL